jgi:uncharacterized Zn finger protein
MISEHQVQNWLAHPMTKSFFSRIDEQRKTLITELTTGMTIKTGDKAVIDTSRVIGQIQSLEMLRDTIVYSMIEEEKENVQDTDE